MWYTMIAVAIFFSMFVGYRTTLSMDKYLDKHPEKE